MNPPHHQSAPVFDRAANYRAPRERRSSAHRIADAIGSAVFVIAAAAFVGMAVAAACGTEEAEILCAGALMSAGLTLILISCYQQRLA